MGAEAVRRGGGADVLRGHLDLQAGGAQRVQDGEVEDVRVAELGEQPQAEQDGGRVVGEDPPGMRPGEAVDRVAGLGFGQRELPLLAVERVAAVLDPVRPGKQRQSRPADRREVLGVVDDERPAVQGEASEAGGDLGDDGLESVGRDGVLGAGGRDVLHPVIEHLRTSVNTCGPAPRAESAVDPAPLHNHGLETVSCGLSGRWSFGPITLAGAPTRERLTVELGRPRESDETWEERR